MSFKSYLSEVVNSEGTASAKRFITLIISFHFVIAAFVMLFIACYVVFYIPKGRVDPDLLSLLKEILKDDLMIIMSGLGFIAVENAGQAFVEMFKAKTKDKINDSDDKQEILP